MKRLFYLFLLVFISIFTLSSCNKNNSTESNNSTNTETTNEEDDSIYQVTKEEFEKAFDFSNIENFRYNDEVKGSDKIDTYIREYLNDYLRTSSNEGLTWEYYNRHDNNYDDYSYLIENIQFENLNYNSKERSYELYNEDILVNSFKFENQKLIYCFVSHPHYNVDYITISFVYNCVNFDPKNPEELNFLDIESKLNNVKLSLDVTKENEYLNELQSIQVDDPDQTSPDYLFYERDGKKFETISSIHTSITGDFAVQKAFGYSFYIINSSTNGQNISAKLKMEIVEDTGLSDAIRILTYTEIDGTQNIKVYQKEDLTPQSYDAYSEIDKINALYKFSNNSKLIFENENINISGATGNNYLKYTVIFWLEGNDPDCNENILGKLATFKLIIE